MATEQTIIFTVVPRGLSLDAERLPVSVLVSPRLVGEERLGAFPDWLGWTGLLQEVGLTITFACAGNHFETRINTEALRPELWRQLFRQDTLVRSHKYDDYTERGIISFSMRQTLSALKSIYQEASVSLALPDTPARFSRQERN